MSIFLQIVIFKDIYIHMNNFLNMLSCKCKSQHIHDIMC
jgi:hypothetical protein